MHLLFDPHSMTPGLACYHADLVFEMTRAWTGETAECKFTTLGLTKCLIHTGLDTQAGAFNDYPV